MNHCKQISPPKRLRIYSFESDDVDSIILEDTIEENRIDPQENLSNSEDKSKDESSPADLCSFYDIFDPGSSTNFQNLI